MIPEYRILATIPSPTGVRTHVERLGDPLDDPMRERRDRLTRDGWVAVIQARYVGPWEDVIRDE